MQKFIQIVTLTLALSVTACRNLPALLEDSVELDVVATVDNKTLLSSDIKRDMPKELSGVDSVTFAKMYIENWVLNQLKMRRAEEVLSSHQADIERLVEGYRQSLIMRQLDQYYIDNTIDLEVTDKQLSAYYRANSASFKLDHDKVRGVVVKAPKNFRNISTLTTALKGVAKRGDAEEVRALCEKHNLQFSDLMAQWVTYSDFLSNLPTERSSSYAALLGKSGVQQMSSDSANFYFVIVEVARKGEVAPLECVKEDIKRRLYAERRSDIVGKYEAELKHDAIVSGRVSIADSTLLRSMSYMPISEDSANAQLDDDEEIIEEEIPNDID
ncbi:MAG: peptidyl-prolyl cis-trans isomerase [Alistipes sp.]|nr:peptidyl-prolyl cis-trans isomerase [Alistipes sp.]